jgi:sigma-B regulation protein RsbU (phosphoserine phosphatase)
LRIPVPRLLRTRLAILGLCWLAVIAMFGWMTRTAERAILDEIRGQARGAAIAIAAALDPEELENIRSPDDMSRPGFQRIQNLIDAIVGENPDVRYVYVMRRDPAPGAPETAYLYVVDERERDRNGNGRIDADERAQLPGTPYDASAFPAMVAAWHAPSADEAITADPPYPDSISGYAPVRRASGATAAIVGVDVLADTVRVKKAAVRRAAWLLAIAVNGLLTIVLVLYRKQQIALERNEALTRELETRNRLLHAANTQLERMNRQYEDELKLAQDVQLGLLPREFPRHERLSFDRCFVTCEMLGGDLYDAFPVGEDRIALYVADVAGHGASAALISGLVKMTVEALKADRGGDPIVGRPGAALARINDFVGREIPPDKFVTIIYAVFDLRAYTCRLASAGHPPPARVADGSAFPVAMRTGPAIGLCDAGDWPEAECAFGARDKLVFHTDGITESLNGAGEEFGDARFLELLGAYGREPAPVLIERLSRALAAHRGGGAVSDDYTLVVAEFR